VVWLLEYQVEREAKPGAEAGVNAHVNAGARWPIRAQRLREKLLSGTLPHGLYRASDLVANARMASAEERGDEVAISGGDLWWRSLVANSC
jgi:hypothetical protein